MSVPERASATPANVFEWQRALRGNIPARYMAVAFVLSTYARRDGTNMHPGIARLMDDTGQSRATVVRSLAWLEAEGWLTCTTRGGQGSGRKGMANLYRLSVPKSSAHSVGAVLTSEHPSSQLSRSLSLKGVQPPVGPATDDEDESSFEVYEWIDQACGGLDAEEARLVDGRLGREDSNPRAILNHVLAQRRHAA